MSGRSSWFLSIYYLRILICAGDTFAFIFRRLHMDGTVWLIRLTMLIDCCFFTYHLCWVRLSDCPETGPTCNLHTRYIHTETHTCNTRTDKKLRHTSYKCLDIKIFKSVLYIYSNTQHQTPVIWARFFAIYFSFIWHDEAILNNYMTVERSTKSKRQEQTP